MCSCVREGRLCNTMCICRNCENINFEVCRCAKGVEKSKRWEKVCTFDCNCHQNQQACTSKCKCLSCENTFGARVVDYAGKNKKRNGEIFEFTLYDTVYDELIDIVVRPCSLIEVDWFGSTVRYSALYYISQEILRRRKYAVICEPKNVRELCHILSRMGLFIFFGRNIVNIAVRHTM